LTGWLVRASLRGVFHSLMSRICSITGSKAMRGSVIHRRGLAKKKGGVGRHITKNVTRIFAPNLQRQRIWVPELKKFVRVRVTARGLKTINKQGAYKALRKAGAI
jgi:large subunit ribosomal protein L28